jgi:hypothetical protein
MVIEGFKGDRGTRRTLTMNYKTNKTMKEVQEDRRWKDES